MRYRPVEIKTQQTGYKFEEFDFSYYNKTRFAGLENGIPNCYCNALLQVRIGPQALYVALAFFVRRV